jgi:hypothetical protein
VPCLAQTFRFRRTPQAARRLWNRQLDRTYEHHASRNDARLNGQSPTQ